jgi:alkylation response protein AidB-like acyl-CoA dehydrogenase
MLEAARLSEWSSPTYAGQLFMGDFDPDLIFPFPFQDEDDRESGDQFLEQLRSVLENKLDPDRVDREGEIPEEVMDALADVGAFAMKIPEEYGGLGLSQVNYNRAIAMVAGHCSSTALMLSAHQSIGVSRPLVEYGTEEQKQRFLPDIADGDISAFALTEPTVGSDPANMETVAEPVDNGDAYRINGEKLWCTNGLIADHMLVICRTGDQSTTAFVVETDREGVEPVQRCEFMGLNGIQNGLIEFDDVRVPAENLIWEEGKGLKLALSILNTGRLTMPAMCVGAARQCHRIARDWCDRREQWGKSIGKHEAVAGKLGYISSHLFAMEAVTWMVSGLEDAGDYDLRIEAAMAKLFCSETLWQIVDHTMQIRGGRGYERADSLRERGETPYPVERIMRDCRLNLIGEGTSEILRMFIAREALDPHMQLAGDLVESEPSFGEKFSTFLSASLKYSIWYPRQWIHLNRTRRISRLGGELSHHLRFVKSRSHKLARTLFHAMVRHGKQLEHRQLLMSRLVDVGMDLFVMSASIAYANGLLEREQGESYGIQLADLFCRMARRRVRSRMERVFTETDRDLYRTAQDVMDGEMIELEHGIPSP